jgi:hypothetical protein
MQEVTIRMREKCNNNMEWIDREEWRRKIKHTEKCAKIDTL